MKPNSPISLTYAQNFEDVLLWRIFGDIENGTYVDVGAFHPTEDSVSKVFYDAGWRGLNVDASSASAEWFRVARPDEIFLNAAITDTREPVTFFEFPGTGLSTCVTEIAERHIAAGLDYKVVTVPSTPLSVLLDMAAKPEIHWLKIDVEGAEAAVLRSWQPSKVRPWVLIIESTAPNSQAPTHHEWAPIVESMGYSHVLFDGLSRFYVSEVHKEIAEALSASPNIFDGFRVPKSHFSASHLVETWSGERRSFEEQIQAAEQRAAHAAETAYELSAQKDSLTDELAHTKAALDHYSKHLASVEEQWSNERQLLELKIKNANSNLVSAEERLDNALKIVNDYASQKESLTAELAHTKTTLDHYAKHLASVEEQWSNERQLLERSTEATQSRLVLTETRLESSLELVGDYVSRVAILEGERQELHSRLAETLNLLGQLQSERAEDQRRWQDLIDRLTDELRAEKEAFAEARMLLIMLDTTAALRSSVMGSWFSKATRNRRNRLHNRLQQWVAKHGDSATSRSVDGSLCAPQAAEGPQGNHMDIFTIDARNPYLRADSLAELCSHADVDFVRRAYVTLLGRQPDADGERYYCDRVRGGISKLTIIDQLRRSPEGRAHDPGIAGLDAALRRHRRANLPIIGPLLRALTSQEGNSPVERRLRSLENQQSVLASRADKRFLHTNHLLVELTRGVDQIGRDLRQMRVGTAGDTGQIQRSLSQSQGSWRSRLQSTLES